jgi:hypothetical protein
MRNRYNDLVSRHTTYQMLNDLQNVDNDLTIL